MKEWILTDDDCMQHVKEYDKTTFELIQILEVEKMDDKENCFVCHGFVETADYSNDERDRVAKTFGYDSFLGLALEYGDDVAGRILAECIFETELFDADRLIGPVSREEAEAFIKGFCENPEGGAAQ